MRQLLAFGPVLWLISGLIGLANSLTLKSPALGVSMVVIVAIAMVATAITLVHQR